MSCIPDEIDTPDVLIDRDILDRNIGRMSSAVAAKGIALRPHVKTHKLPRSPICNSARARGLTVATIGEVEVFVDHGADDVFITYPLWIGTRQADRLRQLADRARIAVGAGTAEGASNTGARLADAAGAIDVLIEIDSGHHRSGVRAEQVLEVAHAVGEAGLHLVGVFTFPGHSYAPGKPGEAGEQERRALNDAANALVAVGFPISCRSGGSTPTALLTAADGASETSRRLCAR